MTEEKKNKKIKKKSGVRTFLKIFFSLLLILVIIGIVSGATMVYSVLKDSPEIDPTTINASLDQTSSIYDSEGNLMEKIEAAEFRTFIKRDQMPEHLVNAFIAIEDERFYDHPGVDIRGIGSAMIDNIKAGRIVRGASTITQQLAKNVYLTSDKKLSRKITEAYLAFQIEDVLTKDQIMEAYLNRNFFGQNAYGVQEAAQTYFAKDAADLTIAESAVLAGIVKSTSKFQPYLRIKPEDFDENIHFQVGEADILGERYILVFNEDSINRQKLVLKKMYELDMITQEEYDIAYNEDIRSNLQPGKKKFTDITSYFSDYVKTEAINLLINELGYEEEYAEEMLFTGGLKIYSTVDLEMQKQLEDVYANFTEILVGNPDYVNGPILLNWRLNGNGDIIDRNGNIVYYQQDNIITDNADLYIDSGTFSFDDSGNLIIRNNKLNLYEKHIDLQSYYRIDEKKNLVTHSLGNLNIPEDMFSISDDGALIVQKEFLDANDFYTINEWDNLIINNKFFNRSKKGAVQPQSASVIMDYHTGHIKALVGGRDLDGTRILNRATDSLRQPGSAIKPLAVYLPALDNGYTAGSGIDDSPSELDGKDWPRNSYQGYKGIQSLRTSVEFSTNAGAVNLLNEIGIDTSLRYLEKLGIIDKNDPKNDNFITTEENPVQNDVNPSSLALGGMSRGLTPLEMTAAFGAIANDGVYIEPTPITKILDRDGNVLIDYTPKETVVVSPEVAFIMKDILRSTVTNGIAGQAQIPGMATAGKTGTTQNRADLWFVGFTPYYVSGVWLGSDSPALTINRTSGTAAAYWRHIMTRAHEGLESISHFHKPEGVTMASVCTYSGLKPTPGCPESFVKSDYFAPGTIPTEYCNASHASYIEETTDTDLDEDNEEIEEDNNEEVEEIEETEKQPEPQPEKQPEKQPDSQQEGQGENNNGDSNNNGFENIPIDKNP